MTETEIKKYKSSLFCYYSLFKAQDLDLALHKDKVQGIACLLNSAVKFFYLHLYEITIINKSSNLYNFFLQRCVLDMLFIYLSCYF